MKKSVFTLIFVLSAVFTFAQHKVSVSAVSDFKTIRNGMVESTFVFDHDLSADEITQFANWTSANKAVGTFNLTGKTLVTTINAEKNHRDVYSKMFALLGVDVLEVTTSGQKKPMDVETFFAHFQL